MSLAYKLASIPAHIPDHYKIAALQKEHEKRAKRRKEANERKMLGISNRRQRIEAIHASRLNGQRIRMQSPRSSSRTFSPRMIDESYWRSRYERQESQRIQDVLHPFLTYRSVTVDVHELTDTSQTEYDIRSTNDESINRSIDDEVMRITNQIEALDLPPPYEVAVTPPPTYDDAMTSYYREIIRKRIKGDVS